MYFQYFFKTESFRGNMFVCFAGSWNGFRDLLIAEYLSEKENQMSETI